MAFDFAPDSHLKCTSPRYAWHYSTQSGNYKGPQATVLLVPLASSDRCERLREKGHRFSNLFRTKDANEPCALHAGWAETRVNGHRRSRPCRRPPGRRRLQTVASPLQLCYNWMETTADHNFTLSKIFLNITFFFFSKKAVMETQRVRESQEFQSVKTSKRSCRWLRWCREGPRIYSVLGRPNGKRSRSQKV